MNARRSISMALVWLCAAAGVLVCSAPALAQRKHQFSFSFGTEGKGAGQFVHPGSLAVAEVGEAQGDVYVVDRGNGRVERFSANGTYLSEFNAAKAPTGAFSWSSGARQEPMIAIDNSTNPLDPSAGDVYVTDPGHKAIDKFGPDGAYIGQLTAGVEPFSEVLGIAVDAAGTLWANVSYLDPTIDSRRDLLEFSDAVANEYRTKIEVKTKHESGYRSTFGGIGFAIDTLGDIYIGLESSAGGGGHPTDGVGEFTSEGTELAEAVDAGIASAVAVDRASNDVYVDHLGSIAAYQPTTGYYIERFGTAQLETSEGIAVDAATGTVYASDVNHDTVAAFAAFTVPDVSTGATSEIGETAVTVSGVVNPDGLPVTSCVFEYGTTTAYGQEAECSPQPGSGSGPVTVSARISGLQPLTGYHYRLRAANAGGSAEGQDGTFFTPVPITLGEEAVSDVSSTGAQLSAEVDPGGSDTTFRFEYGTSVSYGQSVPVPEGDLGDGTAVEPVSASVEGLRPETTYHVRIAATNVLGTVYGHDEAFTTQSGATGFALPDDRMWEMVSPPGKNGASITLESNGGLRSVSQAAEAGDGIAYTTNAPLVLNPAGNTSPTEETQVLATRQGGAWSSQDIATAHEGLAAGFGPEYLAFSPDLSHAIVQPLGDTQLASEAAAEGTPYVRDDETGTYLPLLTGSDVPPGTVLNGQEDEHQVFAVTATPDLSHILLLTKLKLTANAITQPVGENIYEWADGHLALVSVSPEGTAYQGLIYLGDRSDGVRHAISDDGSKVFWSADEGNAGVVSLYMRDTASGQTVQVDSRESGVASGYGEESLFQDASANGSVVFFLHDGPLTADSTLPPRKSGEQPRYDLYAYDTETGTLTDMTGSEHLAGGELAEVQNMVIGAGEDGSTVYFVAKGVLASGARAGEDNLYVVSRSGSSWVAPRFVATLSPTDGVTWGGDQEHEGAANPALMTSRVSPNGRFLAFMSSRSLTGYDNRDAISGEPDEEVFLYDEQNAALTCASCNPTGERPVGVEDKPEYGEAPLLADPVGLWKKTWLAAIILPWEGGIGPTPSSFETSAYQSRYLSNEGRLFFDGFDALAAQDTDGTADVYEYEPQSLGSCERPGGCLSLISSGTSSGESVFLDASGRGPGGDESEDVFFLTASRLVAADVDSSLDIYDAHVCSRAAPCVTALVLPPPCSSGDSCKAAPAPQPTSFGAPASATFAGAGNLVPTAEGATKTVVKRRHPAKHAKHERKGKHRRNAAAKPRRRPRGHSARSTVRKHAPVTAGR